MAVHCSSQLRHLQGQCLQPEYAADPHAQCPRKKMDGYLDEVRALFSGPLEPVDMHAMSLALEKEISREAQLSSISMLPSYHHALPTGDEEGTYLALDVGGSNFRVALVELKGRAASIEAEQMQIKHALTIPIDGHIRALQGEAFFEWMADRIAEVLQSNEHRSTSKSDPSRPLMMGLAWSFPIEQTSTRSGQLLAMGKDFSATAGVKGQDLSELIMRPCMARGLNVRLQTIVNDSSATLLSQAYLVPSTRISLILGTGTNSSIYLPVAALHTSKYGERPQSWFESATHCLVNTELSMHGAQVWRRTRWDDSLSHAHPLPGFQPFELLVGGRYMGEIARLVIIEAVEAGLFFQDCLPANLDVPYALQTKILAEFERDSSTALTDAATAFLEEHQMPRRPSLEELTFLRDVAELVSTRTAAYEAVAVHALWRLLCREEARFQQTQGVKRRGHITAQTEIELGPDPGRADTKVTIACTGSVIEKYPRLLERCQAYIDQLTEMSVTMTDENARIDFEERKRSERFIELSIARDSSIFGAAVAAACCAGE